MLLRVESHDKMRVNVDVSAHIYQAIVTLAARERKTRARYIEDLVERDLIERKMVAQRRNTTQRKDTQPDDGSVVVSIASSL